MCAVKSLLGNVENNVGQTIPSPSELPNGTIPAVTETATDTHEDFNATEYETSTLVDVPTGRNIVRSGKDAEIDSFMKLYDVEEPNGQFTFISKDLETTTNTANTLHNIEENKSNELLVDSNKSIVLRFDETIIILFHRNTYRDFDGDPYLL